MRKKILVVLTPFEKEFKSVHYALALAERIAAKVYILQRISADEDAGTIWMQTALADLINSARQAGLNVAHHISSGELKEDIINLFKGESIDVLVVNQADKTNQQFFKTLKPLVSSQIIKVKEKDQIDYF